jgi:sulfotransferase
MKSDLHFISGLPRSGSTLLAALLNQNPRFRAGITGPVGPLVDAMLKATSVANETSLYIDDAHREKLLRSIFEAFYGDLPAGHVAFDTNRMWCAKMSLLDTLYPQARVICCVRDIATIVDSVERLVQTNALQASGIFGFDPTGSVYTRADALGSGNGLVGFAFNALRQAFYGPHSNHLLIVTYETLTSNTDHALAAIYSFLGQPPFKHDLKNIDFDASAFDRGLGTPGLHDVGREIRPPTTRQSLLPPDLIQKYSGNNFWLNEAANINGVQIV